MSDIPIKTEKNDDDGQIDGSLPELTKLLEEVKREEQVSSDESDFLDDLLKENKEGGGQSPTEDDIRQLQALLEKKKKELHATDESAQDNRSSNRKRKTHKHDSKPSRDRDKESKRMRKHVNESRRSGSRSPRSDVQQSRLSSSESPTSRNQSPQSQTPSASVTNQQESLLADDTPATIDDPLTAESEIANLLKAEDPDDDPTNSAQGVPATSCLPPAYVYPPGFPPMGVPIYDPACQMMGSIPSNSYPIMYNMGLQAPFYPNMGNMPMMGYGIPQMNMPDQNELQCLPVVNSTGFSGMPTFKRIKLEKNTVASKDNDEDKDKDKLPAEDRRKNVLEACTALLEQLEFSEPTGKFTFTSMVGKLSADTVSNSIVQKISNVSYDFHSIGPKLNLADWGLREIGSRNGDIAKKIAISADEYFTKITEKANTIARKLIKVEDANVDDNTSEFEMETEEPTLSSFLKNSMTQTDALVCKECTARKRIIGHNIGVQATVFTGSIGSQTSPVVDDSVRLAAGLNANQLKALYKFSSLIREPSKNTTAEMYRLRENLMEFYNLSQRSYNGPVPNVSPHRRSPPPPAPPATQHHAPGRDPRIDNRSSLDSRQLNPPGRPITSLGRPATQEDYRQPKFNTYQPHPMNVPRDQPPVMPHYGYQHHATLVPMQQSAVQFPGCPPPYFGEPVYPPNSLQGGRKTYGRGSQPR